VRGVDPLELLPRAFLPIRSALCQGNARGALQRGAGGRDSSWLCLFDFTKSRDDVCPMGLNSKRIVKRRRSLDYESLVVPGRLPIHPVAFQLSLLELSKPLGELLTLRRIAANQS
jgi:hypothetical protein